MASTDSGGIHPFASEGSAPMPIDKVNHVDVMDDSGSAASSVSDSSATTYSLSAVSSNNTDGKGSEAHDLTNDIDAKVSHEHSSSKSTTSKIDDAHTTYYPHPTTFKLGEHPIDDIRQLKVNYISLTVEPFRLTLVLFSRSQL